MDNAANTRINRSFSKAARWQIIITVIISGISLLFAGMNAAISALAGGVSVIVGGLAGIMMTRIPNSGMPGVILISWLKAEALKVLVIAMLLLVTFKYYKGLVPLSLIGGLAGSALASGAGLLDVNKESED